MQPRTQKTRLTRICSKWISFTHLTSMIMKASSTFHQKRRQYQVKDNKMTINQCLKIKRMIRSCPRRKISRRRRMKRKLTAPRMTRKIKKMGLTYHKILKSMKSRKMKIQMQLGPKSPKKKDSMMSR